MKNFEIGHDTWTLKHPLAKYPCPRCHRDRPIGDCEDECQMCQSCFQKVHGMSELPSDTMNL